MPDSQSQRKERIIAMIPARYAATRFPAKLMQTLGDKTVILHTYHNTVSAGVFDDVFVVTDSETIYNEIETNGGKAIMSKRPHESGSDRIAEAVEEMEADVIINVQGDEPFMNKEPLEKLVALFDDPAVMVASVMRLIRHENELTDPNIVKVVVNKNSEALYFSRSPIPYQRNKGEQVRYHAHIGIYGFRKQALLDFTNWRPGILELAEKLEQLRYLENGILVKMAIVNFQGIAIDTPDDLERAKKTLH
jgi:3-deoxy-manno-octulosonate cytidylyltransferase (CMP-KDO synthetase)